MQRPAELLERNEIGHMEIDCGLSDIGGKAALLTIILEEF